MTGPTSTSDRWRGRDPLEGIDNIGWRDLTVAYGSAERVPAILRDLAAATYEAVDRGWDGISTQILCHQNTVFPGTVTAVPFLPNIAGAPTTLRRPRLISYLAQLSLGDDVPHSPAGTAAAVRDLVRSRALGLVDLVQSGDRPLGLAIAELAAAMPVDLEGARDIVDRLFATETDGRIRTALAGARAMMGNQSPEVMALPLEAERRSIFRGVRLPFGGAMRTVAMQHGLNEYRGKPVVDIAATPVHTDLSAWIANTPFGVEDDAFMRAARCVHDLYVQATAPTIWSAP